MDPVAVLKSMFAHGQLSAVQLGKALAALERNQRTSTNTTADLALHTKRKATRRHEKKGSSPSPASGYAVSLVDVRQNAGDNERLLRFKKLAGFLSTKLRRQFVNPLCATSEYALVCRTGFGQFTCTCVHRRSAAHEEVSSSGETRKGISRRKIQELNQRVPQALGNNVR
jgi:hypothetical protein